MKLTDRQAAVLTYIREFTEVQGYAPSVREIAVHFGNCVNAIQLHLVALQKKGAVERTPGVARSLRVVHPVHP